MNVVDLTEYESRELELSAADALDLQRAAGEGLSIGIGGQTGRWQIRANSRVGTITLRDELEIRIRPKVSIHNVLYLLLAPTVPPDWLRLDQVGLADAPDAVAAFAVLYARTMSTALARGPQHDYREMNDDLVTLRGRVDLARQLRQPGRVSPIASRYVDFTTDVARNRYIKHAARLLLRTPGVPMGARREIRHGLAKLEDVVVGAPPPVDLPERMRFTRLTEAYRPILAMSRMVREARTLGDRAGHRQASAFLLDMNVVFEKFVEHALRTELRGRLDVVGQDHAHLDHDRRVSIRPDLVLRTMDTGRAVHVADLKYKVSDDERARTADYYQLLAYATAYDLPDGTLLYAQLGDGVTMGEVMVRNAGTVLRTMPVDLGGSPEEIWQSIGLVAAALGHDRASPGLAAA